MSYFEAVLLIEFENPLVTAGNTQTNGEPQPLYFEVAVIDFALNTRKEPKRIKAPKVI